MKHKFLFSLFVIFFICIFIALGSWQLIRLNWKNNLILEIEKSLKKPPIELSKSNMENYLNSIITYSKILSQRNSLLKYFAKNNSYESNTIDIYDIQKHLELIKKIKNDFNIKGVFTEGSEATITVAEIAKYLGLKGISPKSAKNCKDKIMTRKILQKKAELGLVN